MHNQQSVLCSLNRFLIQHILSTADLPPALDGLVLLIGLIMFSLVQSDTE